MLESLRSPLEDSEDTAHLFAKQLEKHLNLQFNYLLDSEAAAFQPIYWLATYLSPVYRRTLSGDDIEVAKKFVKSKFIDCSLFICNFPLHRIDARPASLRGGARGYQYRVRHSWAAITEQETRHRSE